MGGGLCSAWDIVDILQKGREPVEDVIVELDGDRATSVPKVFTRIHMHYIVKGPGLKEAKVERAIKLSAEKYCSATKMLDKTAQVTHDYEIVDTAKPVAG